MVDRSRVLIQDEIEADKPVSIVWGFHTDAQIHIEGQRAILTYSDANLSLQIVEPENAFFKTVSAQPPKPQAQNEGVSNLTIQLPEAVTTARIAVEIIPYRDEAPSHRDMRIIPLEGWDK